MGYDFPPNADNELPALELTSKTNAKADDEEKPDVDAIWAALGGGAGPSTAPNPAEAPVIRA